MMMFLTSLSGGDLRQEHQISLSALYGDGAQSEAVAVCYSTCSGGGPTSLTLSDETAVSMVISWVPPNAHVLQYHVSYTALTGADSQDHTVLVPGGEKQVMLESLQPDARYSILVTAEYHNREGGSGSAQGKTGGYAYLKVSTYRNIKVCGQYCFYSTTRTVILVQRHRFLSLRPLQYLCVMETSICR
ncbi:unnamed protein product [Oreochromis niloticus]|nr:unnamed protein product [Mustela putorius furo]CAI5646937.1 unnamed protein product [Mustela putorius furo]